MNMYLPPGPRSGTLDEMSAEQPRGLSAAAHVLLTALKLRGVGPAAVRKLAAKVRPDDDFELRSPWFGEHGMAVSESSLTDAASAAERVIAACEQHGISILSMLDATYPQPLKAVADAPPILYVKGDLAALHGPSCAVVGTRNASPYGLRIAHKISALLCGRDIGVTSGLALGIDTAAHDGALAANGITVAIMAHGLDTVAPSTNKKLAARILEHGGALVSEHEPRVPPRPAEFVRRNRIQSGMSLCSIIVETGEIGGTMHQARFTRDQRKPVLAIVPENGGSELHGFTYDGGRLLVREHGAIPIRNDDDLLKAISHIVGQSPSPPLKQNGFEF